jgi:hypothetical protein
MSYTTATYCGTDHHQWLRSLEFYKEEFKILDERLQEIMQRNNGKETMALAEHFQNQFLIQRNNIDELKHNIHEHENLVAMDVREHAGKMKNTRVLDHDEIKAEFETLEKLIKNLRVEYNLFLSRWM